MLQRAVSIYISQFWKCGGVSQPGPFLSGVRVNSVKYSDYKVKKEETSFRKCKKSEPVRELRRAKHMGTL